MSDFLEERISEVIRYGSSWAEDYQVDITTTSSGQEDRFLRHTFPRRTFDVSYMMTSQELYDELCAIYHRAHGKYSGFRARCFDEWSSNGPTSTPTRTDQPLTLISGLAYQLRKYYGRDKAAGASGYPYRTIYKPVAGTVIVGVGGKKVTEFTVDTTAGVVTFSATTGTISAISKAAQASVTFSGTSYAAGNSFYISGVAGMTQINGLRATVISAFAGGCVVDIDSSGFSTYTSGGTTQAKPYSGETVTAGFEFDFPVRFDTALVAGQDYPGYRPADGIRLVELLRP